MFSNGNMLVRAIDDGTGGNGVQPLPEGKYYLFVIAIDKYDPVNGLNPLSTPVRDASRLVELLLDKYTFQAPDSPPAALNGMPGIIPYNTTEVKCLYNEHATRDAILEHLQVLTGVLKEDDHLLIYFAGHGDNATGVRRGKIMPYGASTAKPGSWLSYNELFDDFADYVTNKVCRNLLLILDCCCSGAVLSGLKISQPNEHFSRYAVTSAAGWENALDEVFEGSPFTSVLYTFLERNTAPACYINEELMQNEVAALIERWVNINGMAEFTQTVQYGPLNESGATRFAFRLKDPDVPPINRLCEGFIKYLNFDTQKLELKKQYQRGKKNDMIVITTVCDSFDLHKMQGKVLLELLKPEKYFDFKEFCQMSVEPDKLGNDIWEALAIAANIVPQKDEDLKQKCAAYICGRLLRRHSNVHRPFIIYLGCNFQSADRSKEMISFCKEFQQELNNAKAMEDQSEQFSSLFLVIADTRPGSNQFFKRDDFLALLGNDRHVVVASAVEELALMLAEQWYDEMSESIKSRNFKTLDVTNYFKGCDYCRIESFILWVTEKLGVNQQELTQKLWQ